MSNMEDLDAKLAEKERQQRVYEKAMASLEHQRLSREGEGLTLMFAWDAMGQELKDNNAFNAMGKAAEMFCIGFAFLAPVLLFLTYVL